MKREIVLNLDDHLTEAEMKSIATTVFKQVCEREFLWAYTELFEKLAADTIKQQILSTDFTSIQPEVLQQVKNSLDTLTVEEILRGGGNDLLQKAAEDTCPLLLEKVKQVIKTETEKEDFASGMGKALDCKIVESLREYY